MALALGHRIGPYDITGTLGAGGMGEVYRARDTKLGRDVALKVLPEAFTRDPDRLARFQREAQVLASLNHPHIGAIYGFEDSGEMHALVLELVEGDTLADRIARGALPLDDALPIATQIAEALEAAHEQGIIHRDLKPANIKITPDGVVKVLDFGLAKLAHPESAAAHADATASPTITSPAMMTGVGVLLGTAAYMAPEQAKGRAADKRSDIWAFGCVLYEMLAGKRPFDGEDVSDTLAAVLRGQPDWSALPSEVPPALRALLRRCLEKDRRERVADISTALFVLEEKASLAAAGEMFGGPLPLPPLWRRALAHLPGALGASLLVGVVVWFATRPLPPRVSRLTIATEAAAAPTFSGNQVNLTITPDGSRIIYVGNRATQLFVRELGALAPVAVFTGAPHGPFVSPDNRYVWFVDGTEGTNVLKRVPVTGGPALTVGTIDGLLRGATWGPDNTIILATADPTTGLQRVSGADGTTTVLTRPDRAKGERDHLWPELLRDGRIVMFTITALTAGLEGAQVVAQDLESGTRTVLVRGGSGARYVPSGHLIYAAAGTLQTVAFDLAQLVTHGTPMPVASEVLTTLAGGLYAAVAGDGTIAYASGVPAGGGAAAQRTLVWVDRQDQETPIAVPPRPYTYPRLSSDAARVAVFINDQRQDIWDLNLSRTTLTPVTFDTGVDTSPVWMADRRLVFTSDRAGAGNLWRTTAGTSPANRLTESPNRQEATAASADGRWLIFTETSPTNGADVMAVELESPHRVTPLVVSIFNERNGILSPDGRWLAYESDESGRFEVLVRPYPSVDSEHWPVSRGGGTRPLWARSGEELFYVSPTGALMRVGVERAASWAATPPTQVVKEGYRLLSNIEAGRQYDIDVDGRRFLMIKDGSADPSSDGRSLVVIQNWLEELKRLVPVD